ncbi:kelch-like protein 10 [Protopterus annectens]|uniref:kelch-like protein 10 n=1 Tax=Protopterus annectens TaxID=7888 RepID=UPI001CFAF47E|nr:kelch-like protein 10 [Protopterus annectens]
MAEPLTTSSLQKVTEERKMSPTSCEIFNELRLQGILCDAILKVDEVEMKVHRNILCSCSSYFRTLFTGSWSNSKKMVHIISGISPDTMEKIIEYAYTRTVSITDSNVQQLLAAADQFHVPAIMRACCEFLESKLCSENCIGIWKIADYYYYNELKQKAHIFILHNFAELVEICNEFLQLSATELEEIIEKDELNVKQENVVFEAIMKWISHDAQSRQKFLPLLLPKVRMAQLKTEYFLNNIRNNEYVKDSDECKPVILNTLKIMYKLNNKPHNEGLRNLLTRPRLPYTVLFATGGWSGPSSTSIIEAYDARADRWVNVTCKEEKPRAYHGTAYLKGYMYIMGGFNGVNYFNSVRRFDPVKKTWQEVAPMHSKRCYVSVTVLNDLIYAIGGFDGYTRLNTAERYEPETNQWTLISPMHEKRSDASAATLNGKVYICGGFTGNECLLTAEVYNPETNRWTLIAPMGSRRSGIGVIAYGEHVYAVGGFDGENRLRNAEAYNPLTNTWHTIAEMLTPRSNFGIAVSDELLFVAGGYNGASTTSNVEYYDKKNNKWSSARRMSLARSALSCCVIVGLPNVKEYAVARDDCIRFHIQKK